MLVIAIFLLWKPHAVRGDYYFLKNFSLGYPAKKHAILHKTLFLIFAIKLLLYVDS